MCDINELPINALSIIIGELPSIDIFRSRIVCRKWKYIIDHNLELQTLVIFLNNVVPYSEQWFFTNHKLDLKHSFRTKNLNFLQSKPVQSIFSKLKRLSIFGELLNAESYDITDLKSFACLEHLELYNLKLKQKNVVIGLPQLRIFSFRRQTLDSKFKFFCPQLQAFRSCVRDEIFFQPDRIRYLETNQYHSSILEFVNLEVLKVDSILRIESNFLNTLRQLKEILFFSNDYIYDELRRQKCNVLCSQVKICFLGIDFEALDKLPRAQLNSIIDRHYLNESNLDLYFDNYRSLSDYIPFVKGVQYNSLIKLTSKYFSDAIPRTFFTIFSSISSVFVTSRLDDEKCFVDFLKHLKCLNKLSLMQSELPQTEFYDQLPAIAGTLNKLEINDREEMINDFKFTFRLPNLTSFSTNQHLSFDDAHRMFKRCRFLSSAYFLNANKEISIVKKNDKFFESKAFNITLAHNSLDNLIKFLKHHNEV